MRKRGWLLIPVLGGAMGLASCGGGGTAVLQPPAPSAAALKGNWQLTGNGGLKPPALSMTIEVEGQQLYAQALVSEKCSSGIGQALVGGLNLAGVVAADGSFKLTNADGRLPQITVTATAPLAGGTTWSGSYAVNGTVGIPTSCTVSDKGSFTSTEVTTVNGTYAGKLSGFSWPDGVTVNATITQQPAVKKTSLSGTVTYSTPLTGTVQVSGTPCYAKGTASAAAGTPNGLISGEFLVLGYAMDDGSTLLLSGHFPDATVKTLQVDSATTLGGKCDLSTAIGTLTLQ